MPSAWRVTLSPPGPRSGAEMLVHLINCSTLFRALTRVQRAALLAAVDDRVTCHPRPARALRDHGLLDEEDRLTEAGKEIRFWNLPDEHPERVAEREKRRAEREARSV